MQRRTFLQLISLPAIAHLLQACGDGSGTSPTTDPSGDQRSALKGTAPRIAAGADDAEPAAAAINAFAANLHERLGAIDPSANLVFSPTSIALALAMTSAGAKGVTLDEMNSVLHFTDPGIHRALNGLGAHLESVNQSVDNAAEGGEGVSEVQLSIANSLWAQAGLPFEQAFLDLLSAEYDAGVELVDYKTDAEGARSLINQWVAVETKDRIPELLSPGTLTPAARLTLVNAIYLKANWADAFPESQTTDEPFAAPDGEVTVRMMHTSDTFQYAQGDGWQAVEVPYVFGSLSFTVAVGETADTPLPTGDEVFAALDTQLVRLAMPRFDIETSTDLAEVLGGMGMPTAFTKDADFSGMTTAERLMISKVVHQANITVDEKGTEAAAATAVVMDVTSEQVDPDQPVELTIDRPFTFWLREQLTDVIVFMGRVNDPSATR